LDGGSEARKKQRNKELLIYSGVLTLRGDLRIGKPGWRGALSPKVV
jgi:hypothetical protein